MNQQSGGSPKKVNLTPSCRALPYAAQAGGRMHCAASHDSRIRRGLSLLRPECSRVEVTCLSRRWPCEEDLADRIGPDGAPLASLIRTMTMPLHDTTRPYTSDRRARLEYAPTTPLRVPRLPQANASAWTSRSDRGSVSSTERGVTSLRARELLGRTERALAVGDLDGATYHAEKLLELAATGNDAGAPRVVAENAGLLNRVFEARVGPLERRIEVGIAGLEPAGLQLSPRATELLELARGGTTVRELLAGSGFPRRHAARMVAGLLRRHVLVAL